MKRQQYLNSNAGVSGTSEIDLVALDHSKTLVYWAEGRNTLRVYNHLLFDSKSTSYLYHEILVNFGKEIVRMSRVERHSIHVKDTQHFV